MTLPILILLCLGLEDLLWRQQAREARKAMPGPAEERPPCGAEERGSLREESRLGFQGGNKDAGEMEQSASLQEHCPLSRSCEEKLLKQEDQQQLWGQMLPVRSEELTSQSSNTGLWVAGRRRRGKVPIAVTAQYAEGRQSWSQRRPELAHSFLIEPHR